MAAKLKINVGDRNFCKVEINNKTISQKLNGLFRCQKLYIIQYLYSMSKLCYNIIRFRD